jgi:integrase/recombinase XerD
MKTTKTFSVRFAVRACKRNIKQATIYARITVNGRRLEISLKRTIDPEFWAPASGSVTGNKDAARQLNPYIEEVRFKLTECYRQLQLQNKVISIDAIKAMFLGEEKTASTLCSLMEYHNVNMKNILQPGTLKNYATTARYLRLFLMQRHKTDDIYLTELNYQFITEFDFSYAPVNHLSRKTRFQITA